MLACRAKRRHSASRTVALDLVLERRGDVQHEERYGEEHQKFVMAAEPFTGVSRKSRG